MDRAIYLKMCQKISCYSLNPLDESKIPDELICVYDNIEYYPIAYELTFEKGKPKHIAILHDKKANSITKAPLARVTLKKCKGDENTCN